MRTTARTAIAAFFVGALAILIPGVAQADISRSLVHDGVYNGEFYYNAAKNLVRITDGKDNDHLYIDVGYRSEPCGTVNDACEPSPKLRYRNAQANSGYSGYHQLRPAGAYLFIKLCNDDTPPDTCTKWFMTSS
ncbi:hypothetical protein [Crossiella cryophila]|uniref:Secreted protein n=1 Tax=Crossiella cryophila TaxID=43355 RepID=A0A7W7CG12_9PSEU|nr:hypothetical protein [Crossiella cryophila]MBB4678829.1 hypothetical protein [Crossiella cryophila]